MGEASWMQKEHHASAEDTAKQVRVFDCSICGDSLFNQGPPLHLFTFGKLLTANYVSPSERSLIFRQFSSDSCFRNGTYDCNKVLATPCGHLYHSGCIREWFFVRRYDRFPRCPFCNQRTSYGECLVLHPGLADVKSRPANNIKSAEENSSADEEDEELLPQPRRPLALDLDYSDISVASSSYPSEEEVSSTEADEIMDEDDAPAEVAVELGADVDFMFELDAVVAEAELARAQVEEMFASGDSTNPFHQQAQPSWIKRCLRSTFNFIDKYNLIHVWSLIWIIASVNLCHKKRLMLYEQKLDQLEDELVEQVDREPFVPIGYHFLDSMFFAFGMIAILESGMNLLRKLT